MTKLNKGSKINPEPITKITLTETRYNQLLKMEAMINAFINVGVDNWEGYQQAVDLYNKSMETK